ncbi:hypothetical protein QFC20_005727 [Naganishia adeliensis]|uniref:Uncharacterized protein n=1 Tax=Naganishia adeliensis TaxID=92952 RepID=A0ACC2VK54_9TREE|nr:hypothetical protein QFC20_005727 [Naganishia adeliensis]
MPHPKPRAAASNTPKERDLLRMASALRRRGPLEAFHETTVAILDSLDALEEPAAVLASRQSPGHLSSIHQIRATVHRAAMRVYVSHPQGIPNVVVSIDPDLLGTLIRRFRSAESTGLVWRLPSDTAHSTAFHSFLGTILSHLTELRQDLFTQIMDIHIDSGTPIAVLEPLIGKCMRLHRFEGRWTPAAYNVLILAHRRDGNLRGCLDVYNTFRRSLDPFDEEWNAYTSSTIHWPYESILTASLDSQRHAPTAKSYRAPSDMPSRIWEDLQADGVSPPPRLVAYLISAPPPPNHSPLSARSGSKSSEPPCHLVTPISHSPSGSSIDFTIPGLPLDADVIDALGEGILRYALVKPRGKRWHRAVLGPEFAERADRRLRLPSGVYSRNARSRGITTRDWDLLSPVGSHVLRSSGAARTGQGELVYLPLGKPLARWTTPNSVPFKTNHTTGLSDGDGVSQGTMDALVACLRGMLEACLTTRQRGRNPFLLTAEAENAELVKHVGTGRDFKNARADETGMADELLVRTGNGGKTGENGNASVLRLAMEGLYRDLFG